MSWGGPRVRRHVQLALALVLAFSTVLVSSGRAVAVPANDEAAREWLDRTIAAMGQPGKVFRAQQTVRDKTDLGELTTEFNIWIDPEQRKARQEVRRDNNLVSVLVIDGWDLATYDAAVNKVNKVSVPEDVRGRVRNPAFSVLAPSLIAAYQSGELNPAQDVTTTPNDQINGREATKLVLQRREQVEIHVSSQSSGQGNQGGQQQPRTEQRTLQQEYTLYIDPRTNLPIQETVRGSEVDGNRELSVRTAVYNQAEVIDRSAVQGDLLSMASVEAMQASLDQQLDRARRLGAPLFWLDREFNRAFTDAKGQRQPGLVLNDVLVRDNANDPRGVLLVYGTRDEPNVQYVTVAHQPRSDWEQFLQQTRLLEQPGVQRSRVPVPGGVEGTLIEIQPPQQPQGGGRPGAAGGQRQAQLPPLYLVQIPAGDWVAIVQTWPIPNNDGQQVNQFHDRQQIAALAGALARVQ